MYKGKTYFEKCEPNRYYFKKVEKWKLICFATTQGHDVKKHYGGSEKNLTTTKFMDGSYKVVMKAKIHILATHHLQKTKSRVFKS